MKLSCIYSDGMILQRNEANILCGEGMADSSITLSLATTAADAELLHTTSDGDGKFSFTIPKHDAGGPYTLSINDGHEEYTIYDVYFGDVFLLAGQSNMELPISRTLDETAEYVKHIKKPLIRQFEVPKDTNFYSPQKYISGGAWKKAEAEDIYNFSAAGYFFAEEYQADENVPIGLYQTACGGIQIEALISEERIKKTIPKLKEIAAKRGETREKNCVCGKNNYCKFCIEEMMFADRDPETIKRVSIEDEAESSAFYSWLTANDRGLVEGWHTKDSLYLPTEYKKYINVPSRWENLTDHPGLEYLRGSVWLLKRFYVPECYAGLPASLRLGTIIDADETYINGVFIGKTEYRYPPRRYSVPEGLLKPGDNTLVIRIVASQRSGGTVPEAPYELRIGSEYTVSLNGPYEMRIGATGELSRDAVKNVSDPTFYLFRPYGLYNQMIHPLKGIKFKSILFYQGESNVGRNWDYVILCQEMVNGLRELFDQPRLPFVFVRLPYWGQEDDDRGTDKWELFREAQKECLNIPYSAMADIYDLGFKYELHPQNKKAVGHRIYNAFKNLKEI